MFIQVNNHAAHTGMQVPNSIVRAGYLKMKNKISTDVSLFTGINYYICNQSQALRAIEPSLEPPGV